MANNIRAIDSPISSRQWITICKVVADRSGDNKIFNYKSGWSFTLPTSFKAAVVRYRYTTSKSTDAEATSELSSTYSEMGKTLFNFLENFDPDSDPYKGIEREGSWVCIKKVGSTYRTIYAPNVDGSSSTKYKFIMYDLSVTTAMLRYSVSGSNVTFTFTANEPSGWTWPKGSNYYALPITYCL